MRQIPPAEAIAKEFGLRRSSKCWRGDCPRCGAADQFTVSTAPTGEARAYCRACNQAAAIHPQPTQTKGT